MKHVCPILKHNPTIPGRRSGPKCPDICVGTAISSSGDCGGAEDGNAPHPTGPTISGDPFGWRQLDQVL